MRTSFKRLRALDSSEDEEQSPTKRALLDTRPNSPSVKMFESPAPSPTSSSAPSPAVSPQKSITETPSLVWGETSSDEESECESEDEREEDLRDKITSRRPRKNPADTKRLRYLDGSARENRKAKATPKARALPQAHGEASESSSAGETAEDSDNESEDSNANDSDYTDGFVSDGALSVEENRTRRKEYDSKREAIEEETRRIERSDDGESSVDNNKSTFFSPQLAVYRQHAQDDDLEPKAFFNWILLLAAHCLSEVDDPMHVLNLQMLVALASHVSLVDTRAVMRPPVYKTSVSEAAKPLHVRVKELLLALREGLSSDMCSKVPFSITNSTGKSTVTHFFTFLRENDALPWRIYQLLNQHKESLSRISTHLSNLFVANAYGTDTADPDEQANERLVENFGAVFTLLLRAGTEVGKARRLGVVDPSVAFHLHQLFQAAHHRAFVRYYCWDVMELFNITRIQTEECKFDLNTTLDNENMAIETAADAAFDFRVFQHVVTTGISDGDLVLECQALVTNDRLRSRLGTLACTALKRPLIRNALKAAIGGEWATITVKPDVYFAAVGINQHIRERIETALGAFIETVELYEGEALHEVFDAWVVEMREDFSSGFDRDYAIEAVLALTVCDTKARKFATPARTAVFEDKLQQLDDDKAEIANAKWVDAAMRRRVRDADGRISTGDDGWTPEITTLFQSVVTQPSTVITPVPIRQPAPSAPIQHEDEDDFDIRMAQEEFEDQEQAQANAQCTAMHLVSSVG